MTIRCRDDDDARRHDDNDDDDCQRCSSQALRSDGTYLTTPHGLKALPHSLWLIALASKTYYIPSDRLSAAIRPVIPSGKLFASAADPDASAVDDVLAK